MTEFNQEYLEKIQKKLGRGVGVVAAMDIIDGLKELEEFRRHQKHRLQEILDDNKEEVRKARQELFEQTKELEKVKAEIEHYGLFKKFTEPAVRKFLYRILERYKEYRVVRAKAVEEVALDDQDHAYRMKLRQKITAFAQILEDEDMMAILQEISKGGK